jgi:hypothetical protein
MVHPKLRHAAFLLIALFSFLYFSDSVHAQQSSYKRHVVIEECTGTWCQYCPAGSWYLDSAEVKYGDKLIILSWHGPDGYGEPMWLPQEDTLFSIHFGIGSYPTALLDRYYSGGFNEPQFGTGAYTADSRVSTELKKSPTVDFRIVNMTYNPGTNEAEFDIDITPFDITKMMTEDTTDYLTVGVLTENEIVADQTHHSAGQLAGFVHQNVVRAVGGKVVGDKFTLGTGQSNPSFPVRRHYRMVLDQAWDATKVRAKSFVLVSHPKTGKYNEAIEGDQTTFISTYPTVALPAVWIVLPQAGYAIKRNQPVGIVWSKGGSTTNVKLEYTVDGKTTWKPIVASTSQSPYAWNLPVEDYGKTAQIRITDASNPAIYSLSAEFPTPGMVAITKPAAGDTVIAGLANQKIYFTQKNVTGYINFEYSGDGGVTWTNIGGISNPDATYYGGWNVPDVSTDKAMLRVSSVSDTSIHATSGMFVIYKGAAFTGLTLDKVVSGNINANTQTKFTWTSTGTFGSPNKWIQMSTDQTNWSDILTITSDVTSADWTTPNQSIPVAYFKITNKAGAEYMMPSPVAIVKPNGAFTSLVLNGVSAGKIGENVPTSFTWTTTGIVETTKHIDWSNDNKTTWTPLLQFDGDASTTSTSWTTPANYYPAAYFRIWSASDKSDVYETTTPVQIGEAAAVKNLGGVPTAFNMTANYPNPFAVVTTINFDVPQRSFVTLTVRNELGQEVARLANGTMDPGTYSATLDAKNLSTGLYTYTLESGSTKLVGKMSIVK